MRRLLLTPWFLLLAACGASSPTSNGGNPGAPASVTLVAGGGQQAPPATLLPVSPAVIIHDANNTPVPGVTVTFAVDGGGGSITGATATTGANGKATVGSWTLGPAAGSNVLRVTAAGVPPLLIVATAAAGAFTYPTTPIGAGGGTVTITDAGPLNGFSLKLPSSAFPAATQWTVSYTPNATLPRTAGINPLTPLIQISSSVGSYASSFMTLNIPVTVPAGITPFIVLRNPATGTMEVLATTVISPTMVSAATRHLNGDHLIDTLPGAAGSVPIGRDIPNAELRAGYSIQVFVTGMTAQQLAFDVDTHFRPGADDWEFESTGTQQAPNGICAGISVTAIWYYLNQSKATTKLFNHFQVAKSVPMSDTVGIHWASLVQDRLEQTDFKGLNAFINAVYANGAAGVDLEMYLTLKANMIVTGQPQLVALSGAVVNGQPFGDHAAIAWKTVGHQVFIDDASFPGNQSTQVTFDGQNWVPFTTPDHVGGLPRTYPQITTVGLSQMIQLDRLDADWPSVTDGSINMDAFPAYRLRSKYGVMSDTIWLADTLRVWSECGQCHPVLTSPLIPEAGASLNAFKAWIYHGSTKLWSYALGSDLTSYALGQRLDFQNNRVTLPGFYNFSGVELDGADGPNDDDTGYNFLWLGFHIIRFVKLGAQINLAPPGPYAKNPYTFTVTVTGTPPAHVAYEWDFGDGTGKVLIQDNQAVQHTYDTTGTYPVKVELQDPVNKQPMVESSATATVTPPNYNWKFTSATVTNRSGPPCCAATPEDATSDAKVQQYVDDILAGLVQSGSIRDTTDAPSGCSGLILSEPTPQNYPGLPDIKGVLAGTCSSITMGTGSLTIGAFGTGTVIGSGLGTGINAGIGGSINATMHGTTLTGSLVWNVTYFSTGYAYYTVQFTAVQIPPP